MSTTRLLTDEEEGSGSTSLQSEQEQEEGQPARVKPNNIIEPLNYQQVADIAQTLQRYGEAPRRLFSPRQCLGGTVITLVGIAGIYLSTSKSSDDNYDWKKIVSIIGFALLMFAGVACACNARENSNNRPGSRR